jgi:NitT/TauT family transport system ATP-binding protein
MPTPLVELDAVSKRFGPAPAPLVLDRISLTVASREFVSFVGPSGCGKSTLLRLIAGLNPVSEGTLLINGATPEPAKSNLGFVFQEPTLLPWLTVAGNIDLPQKLQGVSAADRRAARQRVLDLVRLADKADAYPRQLSGGQKMRVSLARSLALGPKLLLLDEPFGALDELTREHLNEELLAIRERESWTAFFVTHSVSEAVFLSHRVYVMSANPGRLHQIVDVPLSFPRTADTRLGRDYHDIVANVSHAVRSVDRAAA